MQDKVSEEFKDSEIVIPQEALDNVSAALEASQESLQLTEDFDFGREESEGGDMLSSSAPTVEPTPVSIEADVEPVMAEEPEPAQPTEEKDSMFREGPTPLFAERAPAVRNVLDILSAPGAGLNDFFVDHLNMIPGVNVKKETKYRNEVIQSARELMSFLVPSVLLGGPAKQAATGLAKFLPSAARDSRLVKMAGETTLAAGVGAYIDSANKLSETDENVFGVLKKTFPKGIGQLIPDDIATLDSDSPDTKKLKNVVGGGILGVFGDLALGAGALARAKFQTDKLGKFIPKTSSAKEYFKKLKLKTSDGTVEDVVKSAAKERDDALDELGQYYKDTDIEDVPRLGKDDVFDIDEEGIRTEDPGGVIAASVDAARIQGNKKTIDGRLASIVTDAALKKGLAPDSLAGREIIERLTNQIKQAGDYDYKGSGFTVTAAERDQAAEVLSEVMMDPRMDRGLLKKTLDNVRDTVQTLKGDIRPVSQVGYEAVFKSIKKYLDEYMNMDTIKAQAYLTHSLSGQVADMSEGARLLDGTDGVARAQEMILDRLEYLLVEKGIASYNRGAGLANLKLWEKFRVAKDPEKMLEISEAARARTQDAIADIIPRAKTTVNELRTMSAERPEFLRPLQLAWEFTDGNIDTLDKLMNFVTNSMSNISKAFIDKNPEIPNVLVRGFYSNIYNSVLTSVSTPAKAVMGNSVLMLTKPISVFAGALARGDLKTMKRGWYQYSAVFDTFSKGANHLAKVFKKASSDPSSVSYIMRSDLVEQNEGQMDVLFSFANAAAKKGNLGPRVLFEQAQAMEDLSNNPMLRFGANAMTAMDGFTRAVEANIQARGRAWDKFIDGGVELNEQTYKQASDEIYSKMFDSKGMINDDAVDYASREMALNLDSPGADALGAMINRLPALKPFMLFPRTSANVVGIADTFAPWSVFQQDINKLAYKKLDEFTTDEVVQILKTRGLPVDENIEQTFKTLRAEMLGRKAIGTVSMILGAGLFLNDRLHGNGHFDKQRQRARRELGWQPRSIKGVDGNWYSFDGLGPISDYLSLMADVFDNFDVVEPLEMESFIRRLGFIMSANLVNKSMLAPIEPMFDVLSGNPAALARFTASTASSLFPLSGVRAEFSRMISPQLREFEEDFYSHLRNRNRFIDELGLPGQLPGKYSWLNGEEVGVADDIFTRIWNASGPFKKADGVSKEAQYLIDIEYDSRPIFTSTAAGVKYTAAQRSELLSIIGEDKVFLNELRGIMKKMPADKWKEAYRKSQQINPSETKAEQFGNLYNNIDRALRRAKKNAERKLSSKQQVESSVYQRKVNIREQQKFNVPPFPLENR